jgi:hypothetical protein
MKIAEPYTAETGWRGFSRDTVIAGAHVLKCLGRSGLETLVLKLDLPDRPAGIGGSLGDRANAIARYALEFSSITTSSGNNVAFEIVLRAARAINGKSILPNVSAEEFAEFKAWAEKDGFIFDEENDDIPEVPATDRVVDLDHDSSVYKETMKKIDELETAVAKINDYPDFVNKDQHVAELGAGKRLLKATRVKISAIMAVLLPVLAYLAQKFADNAVGIIASAAMVAVLKLLGLG